MITKQTIQDALENGDFSFFTTQNEINPPFVNSIFSGPSNEFFNGNDIACPENPDGEYVYEECCYYEYITPLMWAILHKDINAVRALINLGADVNKFAINENGEVSQDSSESSGDQCQLAITPISAAVRMQCYDIVELLISNNADLESTGANGYYQLPLTFAAKLNDLRMVKILIEGGAKPTPISRENGYDIPVVRSEYVANGYYGYEQPLQSAIRHNNFEMVKYLVDSGADTNEFEGVYVRTPIDVALKVGNDNVIKFLIEHGADINKNNLFLEAVSTDDLELVRSYIKYNVDIKSRDVDGNTALHLSIMYFDGSYEIFDALLNANSDVNIQNFKGETPLHVATNLEQCKRHFVKECVETLLKYNPDVNVTDNQGRTPLYNAVKGHLYRGFGINVVKCLIKNEAIADFNILLKDGLGANDSLLSIAVAKNKPEVVSILLEHGADVNPDGIACEAPILVSIREGYSEIALNLLTYNDSVEALFENKDLLHLAALKCNGDVISTLINLGFKINHQCQEGKTPLWNAASCGNDSAASELIRRGANINLGIYDNRLTPIYIAIQKGHETTVKLLLENKPDLLLKNYLRMPNRILKTAENAVQFAMIMRKDNILNQMILYLINNSQLDRFELAAALTGLPPRKITDAKNKINAVKEEAKNYVKSFCGIADQEIIYKNLKNKFGQACPNPKDYLSIIDEVKSQLTDPHSYFLFNPSQPPQFGANKRKLEEPDNDSNDDKSPKRIKPN